MCIAVISTAHPDYALVLINNRDVDSRDNLSSPHLPLKEPFRNTCTVPQREPPGGPAPMSTS